MTGEPGEIKLISAPIGGPKAAPTGPPADHGGRQWGSPTPGGALQVRGLPPPPINRLPPPRSRQSEPSAPKSRPTYRQRARVSVQFGGPKLSHSSGAQPVHFLPPCLRAKWAPPCAAGANPTGSGGRSLFGRRRRHRRQVSAKGREPLIRASESAGLVLRDIIIQF